MEDFFIYTYKNIPSTLANKTFKQGKSLADNKTKLLGRSFRLNVHN